MLLGLVMAGKLLLEGPDAMVWAVAGLVPVAVLVASIHWLDRVELGDEQVWTVAVYSAVALGIGSVFVVVVETVVGEFSIRTADTFLLVTGLGTVTVAGAISGVARELQRSNRRLCLRNQVLHRVLRHNLRNDMSVVLCLLDQLEAECGTDGDEEIERARQRIESFLDLTDKVRQVNVTVSERGPPPEPVDVADLVERRVGRLEAQYDLDIDTELPETALARANGEFGLVLDNVVQSAVSNGSDPDIGVRLGIDGPGVTLRIEDRDWSIPDADISAVTNGAETALEHGLGIELWLVYWLVDANGGHISVETHNDTRCVDIRLDRPANGWLQSMIP